MACCPDDQQEIVGAAWIMEQGIMWAFHLREAVMNGHDDVVTMLSTPNLPDEPPRAHAWPVAHGRPLALRSSAFARPRPTLFFLVQICRPSEAPSLDQRCGT